VLVSAMIYVSHTRRSARRALAHYPRWPTDRRAAGETHAASLRALGHRRTSANQQKIARLNAARAAIMRSVSDDAADGLVSATEELSDLLNDPPDDWWTEFSVAVGLVDAVAIRAEKHGDLGGYPRVLALLETAASRTPPDFGAMAIVHSRWADYHAALAGRLESGPAADAQWEAVTANLRAAIAATTPALRSLLPDRYVDLGMVVAYDHPGDLAAGAEHVPPRRPFTTGPRPPRVCAREYAHGPGL